MPDEKKYPCPICGALTLSEPDRSCDICTVCGWEEDGYQQDYPDETGPNGKWTLNEAKKAWAAGETLFANHPNPKARKTNGNA